MLTLHLLHWPWNEPLVDENLGIFVAAYPRQQGSTLGITRHPFAWPDYALSVRRHLAADEPADVVYAADDWKGEWVHDQVLAPLEEHYPPAGTYRNELTPLAQQDLSHDGKLYGLPYYTDKYGLVVNQSLLTRAGVDAPPSTWDEVIEACVRVKTDLGCQRPLLLSFGHGSRAAYPIGVDVLCTLALATSGEDIVGEDLTLSAQADSPLGQAVGWLERARDKADILDPIGAEADLLHTVSLMQSGQYAFCLLPIYALRRAVIPRHQPLHTELQLAPMPGAGRTVGCTRFYAMTQQAVDRGPAVVEAATRLIEFLGGRSVVTGRSDYFVAKKWALVEGLGFGIKRLYDDPDIIASFRTWLDFDVYRQYTAAARSRRGPLAPWWRPWREQAGPALASFAAGKLSAEDLRTQLANDWAAHTGCERY
jgi:multiple sugar transport system substrate-binding protein